MSAPEFFQTRMAQRFYEVTIPKIAEQLERLNAKLEALLAELRKQDTLPAAPTSHQQPDDH